MEFQHTLFMLVVSLQCSYAVTQLRISQGDAAEASRTSH